MTRRLVILLLLVGARTAHPQEHRPDIYPPYSFLRYNEDYSFLADPARRTDLFDYLKYIPLDGAGYLSLGGEARERFETYRNEFFSTNPDADNAYLLQRYLFHADYHPTDWLRFFGQLQSSLEDGRPGGPRPTDRDDTDTHQLFVDLVDRIISDTTLTLRLGRQEFSYGSERLIAAREGPNNRRAFDAARILYKQDGLSIDGFFAAPVEVDQGSFDDQDVRDVRFWGVYATVPNCFLNGTQTEFYYLGLSREHAL